MTKTQLHCPDCATGYLRVLSDEELLKMFPTCRAAECVRHPEMLKTQFWIHPRTMEMHERWARPRRIGVYCDKCGHFHDMDERSYSGDIKGRNMPKSYNIKGYGNYHR